MNFCYLDSLISSGNFRNAIEDYPHVKMKGWKNGFDEKRYLELDFSLSRRFGSRVKYSSGYSVNKINKECSLVESFEILHFREKETGKF